MLLFFANKFLLLVISRGVQNGTNPIEKPQTEPTQTETAKNHICFGCITYWRITKLKEISNSEFLIAKLIN